MHLNLISTLLLGASSLSIISAIPVDNILLPHETVTGIRLNKPFRLLSPQLSDSPDDNNPNSTVGYLAQRFFPPGDVLALTKEPTTATIFAIDSSFRLTFNDTHGRLSPDGTDPLFAFYHPAWYINPLAKVIPFNTEQAITQDPAQWLYHQFDVDPSKQTLLVKNVQTKPDDVEESTSLILQLCDRVYKKMLLLGVSLEDGCTAVELFLEYLEEPTVHGEGNQEKKEGTGLGLRRRGAGIGLGKASSDDESGGEEEQEDYEYWSDDDSEVNSSCGCGLVDWNLGWEWGCC